MEKIHYGLRPAIYLGELKAKDYIREPLQYSDLSKRNVKQNNKTSNRSASSGDPKMVKE